MKATRVMGASAASSRLPERWSGDLLLGPPSQRGAHSDADASRCLWLFGSQTLPGHWALERMLPMVAAGWARLVSVLD